MFRYYAPWINYTTAFQATISSAPIYSFLITISRSLYIYILLIGKEGERGTKRGVGEKEFLNLVQCLRHAHHLECLSFLTFLVYFTFLSSSDCFILGSSRAPLHLPTIYVSLNNIRYQDLLKQSCSSLCFYCYDKHQDQKLVGWGEGYMVYSLQYMIKGS